MQNETDNNKIYSLTEETERINCLMGDANRVYILYEDLTVKSLSVSIDTVEGVIHKYYFERINFYTIVNTRYLQCIRNNRVLEMKNGMKFKVSRRKWNLFKEQEKIIR